MTVFLRCLEYYDGILILTTNRVGTFDEAFKSRIHLTIGYSKLSEEQRFGIWQNFVNLLKNTSELVDVRDLEANIPKLAQHNMNGRQIRNVLTLGRYLARYRKEILRYQHVKDAVDSVTTFDEYLKDVRGSDETWAREQSIR